MLPRGLLIALEGIDGAGKTTQAALLESALLSVGLSVVRTKEPTDGVWGAKIRMTASTGRLPPQEELEAFTEDRKQHVEEVIKPALAARKVVIVDRYYFSSAAYQGARGLDTNAILATNEAFAPQPDLLVVLKVSPSIGLSRVASRGDRANLFEQEEPLASTSLLFESFERPYKRTVDGTPPSRFVLREILTAFVQDVLFRELCRKTNKDTCEPEYCVFRLAKSCDFLRFNIEQMVRATEVPV